MTEKRLFVLENLRLEGNLQGLISVIVLIS